MSLMKFISNPKTAVHDAFCGLKYAYPSLTVDPDNRIVISNKIQKGKVCVLSGGGSGHEPFAAGFVGSGMLSGAVAGFVFAAPPVDAIYKAIRTLAKYNDNAGVLIVILNYTGDVLNFGLAVEKAKTHVIQVEMVAVNDDCSRLGEEVQGAGRRGMCGTCLILKLAGSMAECGRSLTEITTECQLAIDCVATMAVSVSSCTVPGTGPLFTMPNDEIDIGLGIHGEAGISRTKLKPIREILEIMSSKLIEALHLTSGSEICVMLSNTGAVSVLEMYGLCHQVYDLLGSKNIKILRFYSGHYLTSLDMAGFQYCILNLTGHGGWLQCLDAPTEAPGWNGTCHSIPLAESTNLITLENLDEEAIPTETGPKFSQKETLLFKNCLLAAADELIAAEKHLNELDSLTGDGDCGSTLKRLADGVKRDVSKLKLEYPALSFYQLSKLSQRNMGGASGALYGILFAAAAKYLISVQSVDWLGVWKTSIERLQFYSKAQIGDRTMVDALLPAYQEFSRKVTAEGNLLKAFEAAVTMAKLKCDETKFMKARLGKASYVPSQYIKDVDPGAYAVTLWLNAILQSVRNS